MLAAGVIDCVVPAGAASTSGVWGSAVGGGVGAGAGGFAGGRGVVALDVVDRGLEGRGVALGTVGFCAAGFAAVGFGAAGFCATGFAAVGFGAAGFCAAGFAAVGFGAAGFCAAGFAAAGFGAAGFAAAGFCAAGFCAGATGPVVRGADARGVEDFRTRGVAAGGVIGGSKSSSEVEAAVAFSGFSSRSESI